MSSPTPPSTLPSPSPSTNPRKVPPPCWTHDETILLIEAYKDRYIALRRGYLRTADWESVSAAVSTKSSAQCRHKIEKLRQRYRTEKQRSLSFKGKFLSSWVLFKNLDFLDDGSLTVNSNSKVKSESNKNASEKSPNIEVDYDLDDDEDDDDDEGFVEKSLGDHDLLPLGYMEPNYGSFPNPNYDFSSLNAGRDDFRPKKFAKVDGFDEGAGFYRKSLGAGDRSSVPSRFSSRKLSNNNTSGRMGGGTGFGFDQGGHRSNVDSGGDWNSGSLGLRTRSYGNTDGNNANYANLNGNFSSSSSRMKFAKRNEVGSDGNGSTKKDMDPFTELVSSIKVLGEGFLRMEKMKMDMAMEFEKNRMEMELKRSEMLMETQRQTVDAFVKVYMAKKDKDKAEASPDS